MASGSGCGRAWAGVTASRARSIVTTRTSSTPSPRTRASSVTTTTRARRAASSRRRVSAAAAAALATLTVTSATPGWTADVYVADQAAPDLASLLDFARWFEGTGLGTADEASIDRRIVVFKQGQARDLDGMVKRRIVRVLVPFRRPEFFYIEGRPVRAV